MSLLSKNKNSSAIIILAASLGLLALFLGKIYFDNNESSASKNITESPKKVSVAGNQTVTSNTLAINELTTQLLTERQITEELQSKNHALKQRLKESSNKLNTSDSDYLSALDKINKTDKSNTKIENGLDQTDYYNRISLNTKNQNSLQDKINSFIESNNNEENIYFETLKVESFIRQNEVRTIILRKGESIWMLAKRAYGNGFDYHKIMKANPHITEKSARFLKPGTRIRVPK